jgi:hypothetical protein
MNTNSCYYSCTNIPTASIDIQYGTDVVIVKRAPVVSLHACEPVDVNILTVEIQTLLSLLNPKRADANKSWMEVGWVLNNIFNNSQTGLQLWVEFSKKSSKFEDGTCDKRWDNMKIGTLQKGSLKLWARTDNPDAYNKAFPYIPDTITAMYKPRPLRNNPQHTITHNESVEFVQIEHILSSLKQATIFNARMGGGKTVASTTFVNRLAPNARVLVICARQSFATTACAEFNKRTTGDKFQCYLDSKCKIPTCHRLFIQFESLHKIRSSCGVFEKFDFVIVDECESVLTQSVSIDTNNDRIVDNHRVAEELIRTSTNCFFMDAFLSERSFRIVNELKLPYTYHHYLRKPVERTCTRYDRCDILGAKYTTKQLYADLEAYTNVLIDKLNAGKKIYFVCTSKAKSLRFMNTVIAKCEGKKVKLYNSDFKQSIENIVQDWQVDLVITTSTITVGCNFDIEWFDEVFIYASACSHNLIRDTFQGHMRVRHIRDNHLSYFLDTRPIGCEHLLSRNDISERLTAVEGYNRNMWNGNNSISFDETTEMWHNLYIDAKEEANHCGRMFGSIFNYYLRILNYKTEKLDLLELIYDKNLEEAVGAINHKYTDIVEISSSELEFLKRRRADLRVEVAKLTSADEASIDRWYFDTYVVDSCVVYESADGFAPVVEGYSLPLISLNGVRDVKVVNESCQLQYRLVDRKYLFECYKELGKKRFMNNRYFKALREGDMGFEDILNEGRGDLWNKGFELKLTVINSLFSILGVINTNIGTGVSFSREVFVNAIESEAFIALELKGIDAFGLKCKRREKIDGVKKVEADLKSRKVEITASSRTTAQKALQLRNGIMFFDNCFGSFLGYSFKKEDECRKVINGKKVDVARFILRPPSVPGRESVEGGRTILRYGIENEIIARRKLSDETVRIKKCVVKNDGRLCADRFVGECENTNENVVVENVKMEDILFDTVATAKIAEMIMLARLEALRLSLFVSCMSFMTIESYASIEMAMSLVK